MIPDEQNIPLSDMEDQIPDRPVDKAMADDRPAKHRIRQLWLEQALDYDLRYPNDDVPLYLTLCGSEARDIQLLIDNGIIELTEVGGIATKSQGRVVAVERSITAVAALQRKYPGLKIIEQDFKELVKGDSPISFPIGEHVRLCCAKIINLDLQGPLNGKQADGHISFPILTWIEKLCEIHAARKPNEGWCLCLTLNGTIVLEEDECQALKQFLCENFERVEEFATSCRSFFGEEFFNVIQNDQINLGTQPSELQQKVLMAFVPKRIVHDVHRGGWRVSTLQNLHYGGSDGHAAMVSWIMLFTRDSRATGTPEAVYRDSLKEVLSSTASVNELGEIQHIEL